MTTAERSIRSATGLLCLAFALIVAAASCKRDGEMTEPPPEGEGALRLITVTAGDTLDPDGYTITIDGVRELAIGPNDTLVLDQIAAGRHGVEATDIAVNCLDGPGANPRLISVSDGDTTTTIFTVDCLPALFDRIIFEQTRTDGSVDILAVRLDGSDPIELTATGDRGRPSLSADGTRLAFMSFAIAPAGNDVLVMGVDGSGLTTLTDDTEADGNPDWSPDGTRIVFDSDRDGNIEIYIMDADGANPVRLTDNLADDHFPAWSPGGNLIAFARAPNLTSSQDIFVIEVDGNGPINLTDNAEFDAHPSWSPDGERILFEGERDGEQDLFLMDPDGSNVLALTSTIGETETTARFSKDGTRIVFASDADGDFDLYIVLADGSGVQRLTDNPGDELFPVWAPGDESR